MEIKLLIRRFFAFVIDWITICGIGMALMFFGPGSNPEYLMYPSIRMVTSLGFWLGGAWLFLSVLFKDCLFGRRSLGKLIFGLKIVHAETQEKVSFGKLILRNVPYVLVQVEAILVLANKGKRLGDMLAATKVVTRK